VLLLAEVFKSVVVKDYLLLSLEMDNSLSVPHKQLSADELNVD